MIYTCDKQAQGKFELPSNFSFKILRPASKWIELPISFPLSILGQRLDLVHILYAGPPLCPKRFVLTIHDLSPFSHPQFYPKAVKMRLKFLLTLGIHKAEHILCISETTKKEVVEKFKVPEGKISVAHNGVHPRFKQLDRLFCLSTLKEKYGIKNDFILYVGKIQKRKNLARLLEAYNELLRHGHTEYDLVLVGKTTWLSEEIFHAIKKLRLSNRIKLTGHVSDDDLPLFYNACSLFVFPSLLEGFGMPTLEAMTCGAPVAVSNSSSLPEVVGDAALIFDPLKVEDIYRCMKLGLKDGGIRERLMEKGIKRAALFTWDATARHTLSIYQSLIKRK